MRRDEDAQKLRERARRRREEARMLGASWSGYMKAMRLADRDEERSRVLEAGGARPGMTDQAPTEPMA